MGVRRPLAGLCVLTAVVAVGFAIAFAVVVGNEMSAVNAANHWAASNPEHEELSPLDYTIHSVPVFVLLGALLVCFGRARRTIRVGYAVIWLSSVGWCLGFVLFAMFVERRPPDTSYYPFAGSALAGLISAITSAGARTTGRQQDARLPSHIQPSK